jgi:hypothetical protein
VTSDVAGASRAGLSAEGAVASQRVIIGGVRRNPSTVVVLAGQSNERVLSALGSSLNVVLVRPESPPDAARAAEGAAGVESAARALRRASGISASYVVVAADPLGGVAAAWQGMWAITGEAHGSDEFELRAAEALAAWRAGRFELPDFYLGPLRAVRPNRVSVAARASPEAQADVLLSELGSLRPGPWWPSLDEVFRTARGFYPSALAESTTAGQGSLLG